MPRGRSGVITEEFKGKENTAYHDVEKLFKIYRSVNWKMQIKINQVKRHFQLEYGTDVDKFLDSLYQAGMDVDTDLASEKERVEAINHSNKFLKLMDESVELMRKYHPQGERYYWVLYYSYMSAYKAENVEEILDKLEPHCPQLTRVHRTTYFRWRDQAFEAVGSICKHIELNNYFLSSFKPIPVNIRKICTCFERNRVQKSRIPYSCINVSRNLLDSLYTFIIIKRIFLFYHIWKITR